jgi:flagellar basal-body rod modification protein FlgD
MSTTAISSASAINPASTGSARVPTKTLGQDDFLKLLVAQMSSQDPLNPQKDTDFIAQMAQFNTLEQSKVMQADLSGLRSDQQLARAGAMLGQTVTVDPGDGAVPVTGVVTSVQTTSAGAKLVVNNTAYTLDQVTQVSVPSGSTAVSSLAVPSTAIP